MKKLPTVAVAKKEIETLRSFVMLAEKYPETTLDEKIIKIYAYTGTLKETTTVINEELLKQGLPTIESFAVREVIKRKPIDPFHKMVRSSYLLKTRHNRNK